MLFVAHLKQSSLWSSADVTPMPNDVGYVLPWQHVLLSQSEYYNLYGCNLQL
jgi:hypothetical protein